MFQEPADRHITRIDGHLVVDVGDGGAREIGEIYRSLAVVGVKQRVRRILVRVANDDPAGERALRDAVTTMLLAGIPADFKIALVAGTPRIEARYRDARRDLCLANVNTRIFDNENEATLWLT